MRLNPGQKLVDVNNRGWVFLDLLFHPVTDERFVRLQEINVQDTSIEDCKFVSLEIFGNYFMPVLEESYIDKILHFNQLVLHDFSTEELDSIHPLEL